MLEVHIDKGMRGGQTINFRGESDQAPGVTPGDVIIVIEEKPHERFERAGDDLVARLPLPLVDALAGAGGSGSPPRKALAAMLFASVEGPMYAFSLVTVASSEAPGSMMSAFENVAAGQVPSPNTVRGTTVRAETGKMRTRL